MSTLSQRRDSNRVAVQLTHSGRPVNVVSAASGSPASIILSDNTKVDSVCIRCEGHPCSAYAPGELQLHSRPDFPLDQNANVCPASAITISDAGLPSVDIDQCFGCGLCAVRCPVGAISLRDGIAQVSTSARPGWTVTADPTGQISRRELQRFTGVPRVGNISTPNVANLGRFLKKLDMASRQSDSQFPNLLARNLLIANGISVAMRRRGDVNVRMDLLMETRTGAIAVGEVESNGDAMIDTPRNIIDNAAVAVSRLGAQRARLSALIVGFRLPNQRSEYWQLLVDVQDVTSLKVETITVGALVAALWSRKQLRLLDDARYFTGTSRQIRQAAEADLGLSLNLPRGFGALFESEK
jgi:Fe-S-cluster-containing hydrogenase component 2